MYDGAMFMFNLQYFIGFIVVVFLIGSLIRNRKANPDKLPYPPGPNPLPIIGNLRDAPSATTPWKVYTAWRKSFGDLMYLSVLGQDIVIVNSVEVAADLFSKRSKIYSDRPNIPMVNLMNWDCAISFMPYGSHWRPHRRMFHQNFTFNASLAYRPTQLSKAHQLLRHLLDTPQNFMAHCRILAVSIIMSTVYGHEIAATSDRFVLIAEESVGMLSSAILPGAAMVNALPILCHIPSWFPGAGFKQFAERCRKLVVEMQDAPLDMVKQKMESGDVTPCLTSTLLENSHMDAKQEEIIKRVAISAYAAGADTTVTALTSSILAMVLHPDAQKKVQAEIDSVVGNSRLPDFGDRESLPYVEAFHREVMRWRPGTPLGIAHGTSSDDIYNGYYIPKGATVISNVWAMTRDETRYPDPEAFRPERFLTEDGEVNDDSTVLTFGFGRRICPGRHMADATAWITLVSVMAVFNISKAKDKSGNEIKVDATYTDGLISHPLPFKCDIKVRSAAARQLVLDTL